MGRGGLLRGVLSLPTCLQRCAWRPLGILESFLSVSLRQLELELALEHKLELELELHIELLLELD